jgi:hypothetical protein
LPLLHCVEYMLLGPRMSGKSMGSCSVSPFMNVQLIMMVCYMSTFVLFLFWRDLCLIFPMFPTSYFKMYNVYMYCLIASLGQGLTSTAYSIGFVFFWYLHFICLLYIFRTYMTLREEKWMLKSNSFPYRFLASVPFLKLIRTIWPE